MVSGTPPVHPFFSTESADPPTQRSAFSGPFVFNEHIYSLLTQALAQLTNAGPSVPRSGSTEPFDVIYGSMDIALSDSQQLRLL